MILLLSWFLLGTLGYGLAYSYFKNAFPIIKTYRREFIWTVLTGPCVLIAILLFLYSNLGIKNMFKYGIKL